MTDTQNEKDIFRVLLTLEDGSRLGLNFDTREELEACVSDINYVQFIYIDKETLEGVNPNKDPDVVWERMYLNTNSIKLAVAFQAKEQSQPTEKRHVRYSDVDLGPQAEKKSQGDTVENNPA